MLFFCLLLQLSVTTTVYTKENVLSLRVARVLRDTAEKDVRYVSMLARRRKLGWLYSFRASTKIIPERVSVHTLVNAARFLWRSEAVPRRSQKWSVTYRRGSALYLGAVWIPIRPVNKYERGLGPTETEVNIQQEWEMEFSAPNPLGQPRKRLIHLVCWRKIQAIDRRWRPIVDQ